MTQAIMILCMALGSFAADLEQVGTVHSMASMETVPSAADLEQMNNPCEDLPLKVVVIVDPYSSGRFLVEELDKQGWPMVGVQSSQLLDPFWLKQYNHGSFVKTVYHVDIDTTLAQLAEFDVKAVMAGSEPGVLLTEDLQDALKLPGNGADTKAWRRDKSVMQERLRELGIRAIHQLYSDDINEILDWQKQWGVWPIIVKPAMSGGTDGVYWCHNEEGVRRAYTAEYGKVNVNGELNHKLLVQEYLDGPEYIVDCVSRDGHHVLSGIWVYKKTKDPETSSISYEYARFIESKGQLASDEFGRDTEELVAYAFKVLDALNLKWGPSHTEIIMCKDGPCLVETGARMHGLKGPKMTEFATGLGTHQLAVDVAVNNALIHTKLHETNDRYAVNNWVFETMLRNWAVEGVLAKALDAKPILSLTSVTDFFPNIEAGQQLALTRDLKTSPGCLLQVHESLPQCLADIDEIRKLEADRSSTGLYQVIEELITESTNISEEPSAQIEDVTSPRIEVVIEGRERCGSGEAVTLLDLETPFLVEE